MNTKTRNQRQDVPRQEVMLYHGSSNSSNNNVRHLVREGDTRTLCDYVSVEHNRKGEVNGNKTSSFVGPDNVLGKLCERCEKRLKN